MLNNGDGLGRAALAMAAALSLTVACKKSEKAEPSVQAASAEVAAASAAPTPLAGLDECLVGKWKAEQVSLKMDAVNAQGGQNVELTVEPSGASTIDFTPMSEVHATANGGFSFDFKYTGKATSTLKTPQRGSIQGEGTSVSELKVSATAKLPGAGNIPLFKETPVAELANMATAIAGAVPKLANAPAVPPVTPPTKGIDANPVFSSTRYTCQGDALSLSNGDAAAQWKFSRVR